MPHINLQMSPGDGPLIDIFVGVSFPRRDALKAAGHVAPNPIRARALIDTGASCSCVDPLANCLLIYDGSESQLTLSF
jgi:hypothetical protein